MIDDRISIYTHHMGIFHLPIQPIFLMDCRLEVAGCIVGVMLLIASVDARVSQDCLSNSFICFGNSHLILFSFMDAIVHGENILDENTGTNSV